MRRIYKGRLKSFVGVLLILLAAAGIFYWENYGRQEFTYTEVLVFSKDIEAGTKVERSMLAVMPCDSSILISGSITDPKEVVGKYTKNYVPKSLQLSERFFDNSATALEDGQYVLAVPNQWIYSFPQSLRRGDTVYFYAVAPDMQNSLTEVETALGLQLECVVSAKVAFVKDSGNREVVDVAAERMDASAIIAAIEIAGNDVINEKLRTYAQQGYRFLLAYE